MSWKGTFRKLGTDDQWRAEERILGALVHKLESGVHETMIAEEFVEDDGKPFEEGEEIEILIRRVIQ